MIAAGKSDDEIRDFMTERYGDFVLYRPPSARRPGCRGLRRSCWRRRPLPRAIRGAEVTATWIAGRSDDHRSTVCADGRGRCPVATLLLRNAREGAGTDAPARSIRTGSSGCLRCPSRRAPMRWSRTTRGNPAARGHHRVQRASIEQMIAQLAAVAQSPNEVDGWRFRPLVSHDESAVGPCRPTKRPTSSVATRPIPVSTWRRLCCWPMTRHWLREPRDHRWQPRVEPRQCEHSGIPA
jgi:hypothetical protein